MLYYAKKLNEIGPLCFDIKNSSFTFTSINQIKYN